MKTFRCHFHLTHTQLCGRRPFGSARISTVFIAFCLSFCGVSYGQASHTVQIPRVSVTPRIEDFVHGEPGPDQSAKFARVEGFLQRTPNDSAPVSERTVVYLAYDAEQLYAVFLCFDRNPGSIRARLINRDQIPDDDDSVALQLDTFHDRKHAFGFQSNPRGVQQEGIWTEGAGWDLTFDTLWQSEGRITDWGYVILIRVPFKSLRFPPGLNSWGLLLFRGIPRNNENSFWPAYSSKIEGRLNQAGELRGIAHASGHREVELMPYLSVLSARSLDTRDPSSPQFLRQAADFNAGLDAKLVLRKSVAIDFTVNPDFSQVESDQPQPTVNERFEVFFPERRPFFLENASAFQTPVNLLFTRRIADPQFGIRMTGKIGRYALGMLAVDDQSPGRIVPAWHPLAGTRARFTVFRVRRDLGQDSSLGIIHARRSANGRSNSTTGADLRWKLDSHWVATAQAVASSTTHPPAARLAGPAYFAGLSRLGRTVTYDLQLVDRSPGFRTDTGFVSRVDFRQLRQTLTYRFHPESGRLVSWGPDLTVLQSWDHRNSLLDWQIQPALQFEFGRLTNFAVFRSLAHERLRPVDFPILSRASGFPMDENGVSFGTSFFRQISASLEYRRGRGINFVSPAGQAPFSVRRNSAKASISIRPRPSLTIENTYIWTQLLTAAGSSAVLNNHILRNRATYQFTRTLSVRFITQYNATLANRTFTSLDSEKRINADFLLSWRPSPGTGIYLGYNSNLENLDLALVPPPGVLLRTRRAFMNDSRQVFVKLSYLLRF